MIELSLAASFAAAVDLSLAASFAAAFVSLSCVSLSFRIFFIFFWVLNPVLGGARIGPCVVIIVVIIIIVDETDEPS